MLSRIAATATLAILTTVSVLVLTGVPALALVAATAAGITPHVLRLRATRAEQQRLREALPVLLDRLASAMQAGQSLVAALTEAAITAEGPLAPTLRACAADIRATAQVSESLRQCALRLDDDLSDRAVLAIRTVVEVPGAASAVVLRAAATQLRSDLAQQAEIQARRTWVSASAGVAVAAPWITVVALSLRGDAARAYASAAGTCVILIAAALCLAGYLSMRMLGRPRAHTRVVRR